MYKPLPPHAVLHIDLVNVHPFLGGTPASSGDFRVVAAEGDNLELRRPRRWVGGLAQIFLALLALGAAVALVPLARLMETWSLVPILGLPLVYGAGLALVGARVRLRGVALRLEGLVLEGVPACDGWGSLGAWGTLTLPRSQVVAVVLEVVPWKAVRVPAATARARIRILVQVGEREILMEGPTTEEGPYPEWEATRAMLLPLAVHLARKLGCPLRAQLKSLDGKNPVHKDYAVQS